VVTSRKGVLGCRRLVVQFSDPVDLRCNHQRSDKVYARRSPIARTACWLLTGLRSHPYLKVYSAIQADSWNQALRHAVHLAVPFDDYGICVVVLHRWPYCRSLFSSHTESTVGKQAQGELCLFEYAHLLITIQDRDHIPLVYTRRCHHLRFRDHICLCWGERLRAFGSQLAKQYDGQTMRRHQTRREHTSLHSGAHREHLFARNLP
jgi:hypothetical protein